MASPWGVVKLVNFIYDSFAHNTPRDYRLPDSVETDKRSGDTKREFCNTHQRATRHGHLMQRRSGIELKKQIRSDIPVTFTTGNDPVFAFAFLELKR